MKISKETIIIIVIAIMIAAYQFVPKTEDTATNNKNQEIIFNEISKDMVKSMLKDPESAVFASVYFNNGATCGIVNSKNSFGGYSGYTRFIREDKSVLIQSKIKDFNTFWKRYCTK